MVCNHTLLVMIALGVSWDLWNKEMLSSTLLWCISGVFIAGIMAG